MAMTTIIAVVLGSTCQAVTGSSIGSSISESLASTGSSVLGVIREAYTTNAICGKNRCINPIFPGMEDLHRLDQAKWLCSSIQKTSSSMGFCRNAITYDPALPVPMGGNTSVRALVQRQDNAAATMFHYHLAGLGLEAWDYQKPEFANDCIKSIWRMVCFTYFPRASIGCQDGAFTEYIRPCQSSCKNYVRSCEVECCDESVQCAFTHTKAISANVKVTTQGYISHDGPSSMCTGGSRRSATPFGIVFWAMLALKGVFSVDSASVKSGMRSALGAGRGLIWVGALVIVAMTLQGCDYDVPIHTVGNWRAESDYLIKNEFIPPGGSARNAGLNSCSLARLSQTLQCSGRGVCKLWDPRNLDNQLSFCECDRDWADPECRTKRKSQLVAYMLSLFLGFFGADQFYLGFLGAGLLKLFTFGGFGILWVSDIISIGSAPVYASDYRTASDLPHELFVLTVTLYAVLLGFLFSYYVTIKYRANKRKEAMILTLDEEGRQQEYTKPAGYGTKKQRPVIAQEEGAANFNPFMSNPGGGGYGTMPGMGMGMGGMPPGMGGMGPMPPPMMGGMPPGMGPGATPSTIL